jgi:hypothetical protein
MADPKEPSTKTAKPAATSKPAVQSPDSRQLSGETNRGDEAREPRVAIERVNWAEAGPG